MSHNPTQPAAARRVLITGVGGFTGRALAERLSERGHAVVGVSRPGQPQSQHQVDLLDPSSVEALVRSTDCDVVVHLSGIAFAGHPVPAEIYASNVVGTVNLLEGLLHSERPPARVLLASSATVYAPPTGPEAITEQHALGPTGHYGCSKAAMEYAARLYADRLPIQLIRPFNYTGPGQAGGYFVPKIVNHFARNASEIRLGNLDVDRDISSLDDVVEAYVRLIEGDGHAPVLNVCSGAPVRLRSLIELLQEISGRSPAIVLDPRFVRMGEPPVIFGSRDLLDHTVGSWPRQPIRDLLERMYQAALGASG